MKKDEEKVFLEEKISEYVIETDEHRMGVGHRPAKLFKRNIKNNSYN